MKFGKRLASEVARSPWSQSCLDYKAIKRALKHDLAAGDAVAGTFLKLLLAELTKVSSFYVQQAELLEASLEQHAAAGVPCDCAALAQLRGQIRQLIKYVALNYLACAKAIKKRNRHCKATFGSAASGPPLHPMDLLRQEVFFTSPRLAALATKAELLEAAAAAADGGAPAPATAAAAAAAPAAVQGAAEEYQCPICLDVLRSPVVLTCAHRFCWGCLVAHCAAITGPSSHHQHDPAAAAAAGGDGKDAVNAAADGHGGGSGAADPQQQCCGGKGGSGADGSAPSSSSSSSSSSSPSCGKGLVVLEKLVAAGSSSGGAAAAASDCYNCPVCRQPQVMDIDNLQVDPHLSRFVDELRQRMRADKAPGSTSSASSSTSSGSSGAATRSSSASSISTLSSSSGAALSRSPSVASELLPSDHQQAQQGSALAAAQQPEDDWSMYLLPRQLPAHAGRLTVLLDLDGTLVSSFTPRRAPALPPSMRTHLVGQGSALNPAGVFVVERPGLGQFLRQLAGLAEVVVFTAGLEEYACPIIDAIDPSGTCISGRLYRPATKRTQHHQCVKDLALLGRPLSRTVLVDDTPLAFLHQPECGIPVLGFRGDPDDRLLLEAVLPLVQMLAGVPDVRPVLQRRFDMLNWFKRHGYPDTLWQQQQQQPHKCSKKAGAAAVPHPSAPVAAAAHKQQQQEAAADLQVLIDEPAVSEQHPPLLVFDFDRTITEEDAGERLVSALVPELLPWLQGLESPANFVPVTNEVLAEMARRGVSRDALLRQLAAMGGELPAPSADLLRWARAAGLRVVVLSDCNSVFISHILAGAGLAGCVAEVVTNAAAFERVQGGAAGDAAVGLGAPLQPGAKAAGASSSSSYKLVVQPRQDGVHGCPLCPANLCKGAEMAALLRQQRVGAGGRGRVVYAGDGANDICPALALGPHDVVLARGGAALARYAAAAAADGSLRQLSAAVHVWDSHEQLAALVREHAAGSGKCRE